MIRNPVPTAFNFGHQIEAEIQENFRWEINFEPTEAEEDKSLSPPYDCPSLTWVSPSDPQFNLEHAVQVGMEDEFKLFVSRSKRDGETVPGKFFGGDRAYFVHSTAGEIQRSQFEVLMDPEGETKWVQAVYGRVPENAICGGHTSSGEPLFIGRCKQNGVDTVGKIQPSKGILEFGFFKKIFRVEDFEVLVGPEIEDLSD